jgi:hypothetical protein
MNGDRIAVAVVRPEDDFLTAGAEGVIDGENLPEVVRSPSHRPIKAGSHFQL